MIDVRSLAEPTTQSISSRKEVCVDIETSGEREFIVGDEIVLVCFYPLKRERSTKLLQHCLYNGQQVRIMRHLTWAITAKSVFLNPSDGRATIRIPFKGAAMTYATP